jgi:hypothetical protein
MFEILDAKNPPPEVRAEFFRDFRQINPVGSPFPVFRDDDYVRIFIPGSTDHHTSKVKPEHLERWPAQWQAFRASVEAEATYREPDATHPIRACPAYTLAEIKTLIAMGARTVEDVTDNPILTHRLISQGGEVGKALVERAKAYRYELSLRRVMQGYVDTLTSALRDAGVEVPPCPY